MTRNRADNGAAPALEGLVKGLPRQPSFFQNGREAYKNNDESSRQIEAAEPQKCMRLQTSSYVPAAMLSARAVLGGAIRDKRAVRIKDRWMRSRFSPRGGSRSRWSLIG